MQLEERAQDLRDEPPPKMPSERDMKNPAKMQEYMLQMGEYSARQQLKLQSMSSTLGANQELTAEAQRLAEEKRKLRTLKRQQHAKATLENWRRARRAEEEAAEAAASPR
mgnify:CR=1 FL=1